MNHVIKKISELLIRFGEYNENNVSVKRVYKPQKIKRIVNNERKK